MDKMQLSDKLELLTHQTSSNALLLSNEYTNRMQVLKALDYIDKTGMIGLKVNLKEKNVIFLFSGKDCM